MRDWPTGDLLRQENLFLSPPLVPAIPAAGAPEATPAPGKSLVPAKTGLHSLPSRPTTPAAPQRSVLSFLATLSLSKAQCSNGGWQPVSWHLKDVRVGTLVTRTDTKSFGLAFFCCSSYSHMTNTSSSHSFTHHRFIHPSLSAPSILGVRVRQEPTERIDCLNAIICYKHSTV